MIKRILFIGVLAGMMLPRVAFAQDRPTLEELGPFPESKARMVVDFQDTNKWARLATTSYHFLKLKANARSAGMGDAYVAVCTKIHVFMRSVQRPLSLPNKVGEPPAQ